MARVSKEYYEIKKSEIIDATLKVCEKKTVSSITMQDLILADNFPDRARVIFPNVVPARDIDTHIFSALVKEVEAGVITPKIPLEEFMEYNASVFEGIVGRAISENSLKRNRDFDESNSYDIKKRFETFARSSLMFYSFTSDNGSIWGISFVFFAGNKNNKKS